MLNSDVGAKTIFSSSPCPPTEMLPDLPEGDSELKASLTIKTGARESNPRGGKTLEFRFKASEGYPVLKL